MKSIIQKPGDAGQKFAKLISISIAIGLLIFSSEIFGQKDEFCGGYEKGFVRGYCYGSRSCAPPIIPGCPELELDRDESAYQSGYDAGFVRGQRAKKYWQG